MKIPLGQPSSKTNYYQYITKNVVPLLSFFLRSSDNKKFNNFERNSIKAERNSIKTA